MPVLYGRLKNGNSFDSAQSEVSGGAAASTFTAVTPAGATADVSCPRRQTDTEVKRAGGVPEAG